MCFDVFFEGRGYSKSRNHQSLLSNLASLVTPPSSNYLSLQLSDEPISGRVDRASATEAVDSSSIPDRVKPKTIKIGIHSFPA